MNTEGHHLSARRLGAEGMVLLRNAKGLLPLDGERLGRVLVTGPAAGVVLQGGGSGGVPAYREVTAVDGLRAALAGKAEVVYLEHAVEMGANRGARQEVAAGWYAKAAEAAREADVVVYVAAGERGHEGRDLSGMELPGNQAETIAAMGAANERLVVVLVSNGAVSLEGWGEKAGAIVAAHYAGQATGEALADVLTGAVNPGGKLSYTWGRRLGDYAVHAVGEWPARLVLDEDPGSAGFTPEERKATHAYSTDYKEGVFGGYRWFDEEGTAPVFPFGYGLSYTSFEISGLEVRQAGDCYRVACVVKNTGDRAGAEVVQVYVRPVSAMPVERPVRELKGFAKVRLAAGEARRVEVSLRAGALAFYDVAAGQWRAAAGEYEIEVGNSSRDLGLQERVVLEEDRWFEHY